MNPLKAAFVVNPISDFGRTLQVWKQARLVLSARGIEFTELITERPGDASAMTRKALADGVQQIVSVGGDGTLNEVVNGYLDQDGKAINPCARLGLIPSGTGSDFRKTIGIKNARAALEVLANDTSKLLDAGRVHYTTANGARASRFFINMVSIGLGGDVSRLVNSWRHLPRWIGGKTRFTLAAVGALGRYKQADLDLAFESNDSSVGDHIQVASNLIVVGNGRFAGGGMLLAPDASPYDGMFDVVITDRADRLDVIRELPRIRRGAYIKNPKVRVVRTKAVSIEGDRPLPLDIDGESEGFTPADFAVLPAAVRFAV